MLRMLFVAMALAATSPCTITGKVTNLADDKPVAGAVRAHATPMRDSGATNAFVSGVLDKDGAYTISLPGGTLVKLVAESDGHFASGARIICYASGKSVVRDFQLRFADVKVDGLVVDKNGEPVAKAELDDGDTWWITDATGRFSAWISTDSIGSWAVRAPGFATTMAELREPKAPAASLRVQLRPATMVVAAQPCLLARYHWVKTGDAFGAGLWSNMSDGKIALEVPPGTEGHIETSGCAFGASPTIKLAEGESRAIDLRARPARALSGKLKLDRALPGMDAQLRIELVDMHGARIDDTFVTFGKAKGEFKFAFAPPTAVRVRIVDNDAGAAGELDVPAGAKDRTDLMLTVVTVK